MSGKITMAKKGMLTEAQDTIVDVAKAGAAIVKPVASAALSAAAVAATGRFWKA
jgi:hypothetical protein